MTILFFAEAERITGIRSECWQEDSLDLDAFWALMLDRHPGLAGIRPACMIAVNDSFVRNTPETLIRHGDEVAVMTAFSGG